MIAPSSSGQTVDNPLAEERPVDALLRLSASARLLRAADGRSYAQVKVGGRTETYGLKSAAFRNWQIDAYMREYDNIPSDWAVRRVLGALEAAARFQGGTHSIFVRVGQDANGDGSTFYLDLADPNGKAVKISPEGWSVVANPTVHFLRPDGHLPLPTPSRDGSIELLRPYANLTDPDFRLLIAWMAAALRPVGPYPILAVYGEHGSAKSTLVRVIQLLIDPQAGPLVAVPRNTRDLMASAVNGWLFACDNVSVIRPWLSDGLCMLATGGTYAGHAAHTCGERSVIHALRPVILSGIDEFIARRDLSDRTVFLNLPNIAPSKIRLEAEFWPAFKQDYPRILGGLLDAVVGGLQELPSVQLTELPRMADFANFAEAVGRKLGWPAETVLADYTDNRREAALNHLADSPVGTFLLENPDLANDWIGRPCDLLARLTTIAGKRVAAAARWPKSAQWLTIDLRRNAPQLRIHGIDVGFTRTSEARLITLSRTNLPPEMASLRKCD